MQQQYNCQQARTKVTMKLANLSCSLFGLSWRITRALGFLHVRRTALQQSSRPLLSLIAMKMSKTTATHNDQKKYAPSQSVVDPGDGTKWRKTVACAVFNSKNELLIGERVNSESRDSSWQCSQGGVDDAWEGNGFQAETVAEAATRELYEEMGLECGKGVVLVESACTDVPAVRYDTSGTDSWLTKNGFQGQELHWSIFRCVSGLGDSDPSRMCDLSGCGGEAAEFSNVQWKPVDWVVENIWPSKQSAYQALQKALPVVANEWEERCNQLDFTGTWSRDATLNENVVEGFVERGIEKSKAIAQADTPYMQTWQCSEKDGSNTIWKVDTYNGDDIKTIRRSLDYKVGPFQETFTGQAFLFQQESGGTLERRTAYVAEPDSDSKVAHVVITQIPQKDGAAEESRRYLKNGSLVLQRTYWAPSSPIKEGVRSREFFLRVDKD